MAIFHYPFTIMKLSASCPLLSLIISFITLTKDHPPHWRQVQEKSFQDHEQSSSDAQKKSTELILLKAEMCKHKKSTSNKSKKKKRKRRKRIPAENGAPEIAKKTEGQKSEVNPPHDDPWSNYPQNTFWAYYHFFCNPEP